MADDHGGPGQRAPRRVVLAGAMAAGGAAPMGLGWTLLSWAMATVPIAASMTVEINRLRMSVFLPEPRRAITAGLRHGAQT